MFWKIWQNLYIGIIIYSLFCVDIIQMYIIMYSKSVELSLTWNLSDLSLRPLSDALVNRLIAKHTCMAELQKQIFWVHFKLYACYRVLFLELSKFFTFACYIFVQIGKWFFRIFVQSIKYFMCLVKYSCILNVWKNWHCYFHNIYVTYTYLCSYDY